VFAAIICGAASTNLVEREDETVDCAEALTYASRMRGKNKVPGARYIRNSAG
jgi:hypothetical protein